MDHTLGVSDLKAYLHKLPHIDMLKNIDTNKCQHRCSEINENLVFTVSLFASLYHFFLRP